MNLVVLIMFFKHSKSSNNVQVSECRTDEYRVHRNLILFGDSREIEISSNILLLSLNSMELKVNPLWEGDRNQTVTIP